MAIKHLNDDRIQEYLDGVLAPPEHAAVKAHLNTCARCRRSLEQYRSLYHALAEEPMMELSKDFADVVMRRVSERPGSGFNVVWLWPVAAAAVLVAIHIWLVDLNPVWIGIEGMFDTQAELLGNSFNKGLSALRDYAQGTRLLFGAALSLAMVAALDRLTRTIRRGRITLLG